MLVALGALDCAKGSSVECVSAAIVGGTEHAEYLALASSQERAILRLRILDSAGTSAAFCTSVMVGEQTALTAAHCFPSWASALELEFALAGADARLVNVPLADVELHPNLDLALIPWADTDVDDGVRPISVDLGYQGDIGDLVQIAGYGRTEQGETGALRFAAERIVETADEFFRISADGRAGACEGDSGGPALSRDSDGSVRVVGILSTGASGCAATDQYTRLSGIAEWLATRGVVPGSAEAIADCRFVGLEGRCFATSVLTCSEDGSARLERCGNATVCGYDPVVRGFHCVPPSDDRCEGIGDLGDCVGEDRLRCEEGEVSHAPCGACGASCRRSVRDGRAICTR